MIGSHLFKFIYWNIYIYILLDLDTFLILIVVIIIANLISHIVLKSKLIKNNLR